MKILIKNKILLEFAFVLLLFAGCEDFLKEDPKNFISPSTFYNTEKDAEAGVTGIYAALRKPYNGLNGIFNLNYVNNEYSFPANYPNNRNVGFIAFSSDDVPVVAAIWYDFYEVVKRSNNFIDNIETREVEFSDELKKRFIAEAKFMRALSYYNLALVYGDVPLITKSFKADDDFFVERDPVENVWAFVVQDLESSIADLPHKSEYTGKNISRANKEAAKTLLAKVHMINFNWTKANAVVDEIITSNEYALEPDILDNWRVANEHGIESIFEIDFGSNFSPPLGSVYFNMTAPRNLIHPKTGNVMHGWGGLGLTPQFYNLFDIEDYRKLELIYDTARHDGPWGRFFTSKYFDPEVMIGGSSYHDPVNFVVFRYADVLLMKAEIENEINNGPNNEAYDAIGKVRARSNAIELVRGLSYEEFLQAVFEERAKELFGESHRFYDLKRRGFQFLKERVEPARQHWFDHVVNFPFNYEIKEYMMVLPIPQAELDANPKLVQNPGFN